MASVIWFAIKHTTPLFENIINNYKESCVCVCLVFKGLANLLAYFGCVNNVNNNKFGINMKSALCEKYILWQISIRQGENCGIRFSFSIGRLRHPIGSCGFLSCARSSILSSSSRSLASKRAGPSSSNGPIRCCQLSEFRCCNDLRRRTLKNYCLSPSWRRRRHWSSSGTLVVEAAAVLRTSLFRICKREEIVD